MKRITFSIDEETYRRAHMRAAEQDTSVSALIERFLIELTAGGSHAERLEHEERVLQERVGSFTAGNRLSRDETHDRRAAG